MELFKGTIMLSEYTFLTLTVSMNEHLSTKIARIEIQSHLANRSPGIFLALPRSSCLHRCCGLVIDPFKVFCTDSCSRRRTSPVALVKAIPTQAAGACAHGFTVIEFPVQRNVVTTAEW